MKGTQEVNERGEPQKKRETPGRHLRLPGDLDAWLTHYATREGFTSEMELVRHIIRDFRGRVDLSRAA